MEMVQVTQMIWYGDGTGNVTDESSSVFLPNAYALVAVIKGVQTVKRSSNGIQYRPNCGAG